MISNEEKLETSGHLQKDYMIYCDLYNNSCRDCILRGIEYSMLDENSTEEDVIKDISSLEDKELKFVETTVKTFCKTSEKKMNYFDIYCLSRSIHCCYFKIKKVEIRNAYLSSIGIRELSKSFKNKPLESLLIERNYIKEFAEMRDKEMYKEIHGREFGQKKDDSGTSSGRTKKKNVDSKNRKVLPKIPKDFLTQCSFLYYLKRPIKHITFRDCNLNDKDLEIISKVLATHNFLESLSLYGNKFGDKGLECLSEALKTNCRLKRLNIGMNNNITDEGVNKFFTCFGGVVVEGVENMEDFRVKKYKSYYDETMIKNIDNIPIPEEVLKVFADLFPKRKFKTTSSTKEIENENFRIIQFPKKVVKAKADLKKVKKKDTKKKKGDKKEVEKKKEEEVVEEEQKWVFSINGNQTLTHLNLSSNRNITNKGVEELINRVYHSKLKRINLKFTQVDKDTIIKIGEVILKKETPPPDDEKEKEEKVKKKDDQKQ